MTARSQLRYDVVVVGVFEEQLECVFYDNAFRELMIEAKNCEPTAFVDSRINRHLSGLSPTRGRRRGSGCSAFRTIALY
jgi:hypothetical protein